MQETSFHSHEPHAPTHPPSEPHRMHPQGKVPWVFHHKQCCAVLVTIWVQQILLHYSLGSDEPATLHRLAHPPLCCSNMPQVLPSQRLWALLRWWMLSRPARRVVHEQQRWRNRFRTPSWTWHDWSPKGACRGPGPELWAGVSMGIYMIYVYIYVYDDDDMYIYRYKVVRVLRPSMSRCIRKRHRFV